MAIQQTILVVDDDPHSTEIIRETLQEDYKVHCVTSGEDCLQEVMGLNPDLILMDMMMPGMSGADVCRRLKKDAETQNVPVLFVSSLESQYLELFAGNACTDSSVHKPIDVSELLDKVKNHLDSRS